MDERLEETVRMIRKNSALLHSSVESVSRQRFIEKDEVYTSREKTAPRKDGSIVLSFVNTVRTAYIYDDGKSAVVNWSTPASSSGRIPSGEFLSDESLRTCTTLLPSIMTPCMAEGYRGSERRNTHKRRCGDIIYSPIITVFSMDGKHPLSDDEFFSVNVMSSVFPEKDEFLSLSDEGRAELCSGTAERILTVAAGEGNDTLVIPVPGLDLTLEGRCWRELLTGKFHDVFSCVSFVLDESHDSEFSACFEGMNPIELRP